MAAVTHEVVINKPVSEVFEFWKNFENFPRFMENIESIQVIGPEMTHWKMKGPFSIPVEWDAKTTYIEEDKKISWESVNGTIDNHGSVVFESIDDSTTRITVGIEYKAPGGPIGEAVAKLINDPQRQLEEDLRRFKQVAQEDSVVGAGTSTTASGAKGADHTAAVS